MESAGDGAAGRSTNRGSVRSTISFPALFPIVVCLSCLVIVGLCLYAADLPAWSTRVRSTLVPRDGTVDYLAGDSGAAPVTSVETALLGVVETSQSVDHGLADAVLGSLGTGYRGELWRTRSRVIGAGGPTSVAVYRTERGIGLVAEAAGDRLRTYHPALQLTAPGGDTDDRWSVRGTIGGSGPDGTYSGRYSGTFTSRSAGTGCVRVAGSMTITDGAGTQHEDSSRVWCGGRGVVSATVRAEGVRTAVHAVAAPSAGSTNLLDRRYTWPAASGWSARQVMPVDSGADGEQSALPGAPANLQPVVTTDGVLVRATQQADDLIGFASQGRRQVTAWQVHPGGTVIGLATSGNEVVVTTAQRELVGYRSDGRLLWRQSLGDVAIGPPLIIAGPHPSIAVLTSTGRVIMINAASGRITWRQQIGDVLGLQPVVASGVIAVATAPGTLVAVDQQTGRQLWQDTLPGIDDLASDGNRFLVGEGRNVHSFDARSGTHLWRRATPGSVRQVVPVRSKILAVGTDQTTVLSAAGEPRGVAAGYQVVSTDGTSWLGWQAGAVDVHDQSDKIIRSIGLPALKGTFDPRPVSDPNGAWIFGSDWTSVRVGVSG